MLGRKKNAITNEESSETIVYEEKDWVSGKSPVRPAVQKDGGTVQGVSLEATRRVSPVMVWKI